MFLQIGVRQRGCNGFTYTLDYATKIEKFDECVPIDDSTGVNDIKQVWAISAR
jgi:iron-sulfur cluster assembly protein